MKSLSQLSGNDLKIFFLICRDSIGGQYCGVNRLKEYGLSYPTILAAIEELERRKMVEKLNSEREVILRLVPPYDNFAYSIKNFNTNSIGEKHGKDRQILEIIIHYGLCAGVSEDTVVIWANKNIHRLYEPALELFDICSGKLDRVKKVITRARDFFEGEGLSWTLQGAVIKHVHKFLKFKDESPKSKRGLSKCCENLTFMDQFDGNKRKCSECQKECIIYDKDGK